MFLERFFPILRSPNCWSRCCRKAMMLDAFISVVFVRNKKGCAFDCFVISQRLHLLVPFGWGLRLGLVGWASERMWLGHCYWLKRSASGHPLKKLDASMDNSLCPCISKNVVTDAIVWLLWCWVANSFCNVWTCLTGQSNWGWSDACQQRVGHGHMLAIF